MLMERRVNELMQTINRFLTFLLKIVSNSIVLTDIALTIILYNTLFHQVVAFALHFLFLLKLLPLPLPLAIKY